MARITLFWCFWTITFLNGMMEFQVKFCHLSGLRLWRPWMLLSTKSKGHKSNFRISGMYRFCFYDLKVQFWWPNKCSKHQVLRLNTLYCVAPVLNKVLISFSLRLLTRFFRVLRLIKMQDIKSINIKKIFFQSNILKRKKFKRFYLLVLAILS